MKSQTPFQETIPRKKPEKLETVINTCVSIIKQHWKKMTEIPQKQIFIRVDILRSSFLPFYVFCCLLKSHNKRVVERGKFIN